MNPYKVLGVDSNASDEEVKRAYRELVKKYHPDRYADNELKDLASEKLKQVNAAYDEIQRLRQNKSSAGYEGASGRANYSSTGKYQPVWSRIQAGDLNGAESLLDTMSPQDAEWHFLKGMILQRRGWYDGARQHFYTATNMDPSNMKYRQAYATVNNMGGGFTDFYGNNNPQYNDSCSCCDVCGTLALLDCLCGGSRCC